MTATIPFDVWYEDLEYLLSIINKCNFNVIDLVGSYGYSETNITLEKEGLYSFKCTRNAIQYNKPLTSPGTAPTQGTITGIYQQQSIPIVIYPADQISYYQVEILCTKERLLKITVYEKWSSNYSSLNLLDNDGLRSVHSVIFHDNDVLANGEWYKYDSPDAFIKDVGDNDISILCMIDMYENFLK